MKTSFVDQVLKIVRSKKPKKFGSKAYIASVWQVGFADDMTLAEFKRRLIVEHQAGKLELSQADLVAAMDQVQLDRSETQYLNATYHFIRGEPPKSGPSARPKGTNTLAQAAAFQKALGLITAANPPGALLSVREVRAAAKLPKDTFDALALNLARHGRIVLHHHDFPSSLSVKERSELIEDLSGTHYVGIAYARPIGPVAPMGETRVPSRTLAQGDTIKAAEKVILDETRKMGATNEKPIRIPALRKRLALLLEAPLFDAALGQLQLGGKVRLYRDDNSATAESEGAYFVAGNPRHILYLR
jgi:hypothetical protein